jgi:hypothetical protein
MAVSPVAVKLGEDIVGRDKPEKVTVKRFAQPENASDPMVETVLGIVKLVKDVQSLNIPVVIVVTRFPKVTLARLVQPKNILGPRDDNAVPFTNITLVNVGIPENATFSIFNTVFGIVILVNPDELNEATPIVETVLGIVKLVKNVQVWNIPVVISVTRFPKVTVAKLVHELNILEPRDENAVLPLSNVAVVNVDI